MFVKKLFVFKFQLLIGTKMFSHDQQQICLQRNMNKQMHVGNPQANNYGTTYHTSQHNYVSDWNSLPENHHENRKLILF